MCGILEDILSFILIYNNCSSVYLEKLKHIGNKLLPHVQYIIIQLIINLSRACVDVGVKWNVMNAWDGEAIN